VIDLTALEAAAALMLADHPEGCPDRGFWKVQAAWFRCVIIDEKWEPETAPRIRERTTALELAALYLTVHAPAAGTEVTS
jgi:hypothetical protein